MEKILNEEKYIERILMEGSILDNPYTAARLLTKHYIIEGLKKKETKSKVLEFLESKIKKFSYDDWEIKIEKTINRTIRDKKKRHDKDQEYTLYKIDEIKITNQELNRIKIINDIEKEKLAFVLLVNGKINKLKYGSANLGVNCNKDLFAEAELKFTLKNKKIINYLQNLGYVKISEYQQSDYGEILFSDKEDQMQEGIIIDNFRDIVLFYCKWVGETIKVCGCGRNFRPNANAQKKCKECKHADKLKRNRKYMQSLRQIKLKK